MTNGSFRLKRIFVQDAIADFFKALDTRLKVLFVAIGLQNWSASLPSQYNQLYATALGADPIELGSLNSIGALVNSAISAPIGWIIDKYRVKRMLLLGAYSFSNSFSHIRFSLQLVDADSSDRSGSDWDVADNASH